MTTDQHLTVGQVAEQFGVTVRTLHHYDEIGLLRPSERSHAGYRLYTGADLERLRTAVVYRRLGFSLEEVARLLDGEADLAAHLRRQRDAVTTQIDELHELVDALDHALEKQMSNHPLTDAEKRELFGDAFSDEYTDEAQQRWGDTDAWKQSAERTGRYTKVDWEQIKTEVDGLNTDSLRLFTAGVDAGSAEAMAVAEMHRAHIDRWFYDCPPAFHLNLGELYVGDPRYAQNMAPGLGEDEAARFGTWWRDAIVANASRPG